MRVALLTERAHAVPRRAGGWCDRLVAGLAEHRFERYVLVAGPAGAAARPGPGVRALALRGPRPPARAPGPVRRRQYAAAYEQLVRALVLPAERSGFAAGLHRLAELARQDAALPAFLASGRAHQVLERAWRSPGAETAAGQPLVHDVLVAGDLLEQCLRPLAADWYGADGLGAADLCHVVGGGPAVLPALVAKELYGVPFVLTEHGLHLREQYLGYRQAPYRRPVRALLLGFFRQLTAESYRQAALLAPGSEHDRAWQLRCGADPARIRVVHRDVPVPADPVAEPGAPIVVWSGPLAPPGDPELMLHAFARVRAAVPRARLVLHGAEGAPGYRAHCAALADRLGLLVGAGREVRFDDGPVPPWGGGTVAAFAHRSLPAPGPLVAALLSGRAVVATDVGVAREVLGPSGLLVPPGEPSALAAACQALLVDPERRKRLARAGRQRAAERFAVRPSVAAYREAYLELAARWPVFATATAAVGAAPRPFARPAEYWLAGAAVRAT